jgi:hypothetical protein
MGQDNKHLKSLHRVRRRLVPFHGNAPGGDMQFMRRFAWSLCGIKRRRVHLFVALAVLVLNTFSSGPQAHAQTLRVSVDTAKLSPDARAAVRAMHSYLASKNGRYFSNAGTASPLWVEDEQRRWPTYDLAALYLPDGGNADIVAVEAVGPPAQREFRITTRFTVNNPAASVTTPASRTSTTVYAVNRTGQWQMMNALTRNTAAWKRDTVGMLEFVYPAEYRFNRVRAESASTFVDSLAEVMRVPRIERHAYYLTNSVNDAYAAMGLSSEEKFGDTGGVAQPENRQVFSGTPSVGENNRHELARIVLNPLITGSTSSFVSEGVRTWMGGTGSANYAASVAQLAAWLNAHPQVTLDSLMRPGYPTLQTHAAGAVITEMVHDVGGRHGVRLMFDAGATASELREGLQRITKYGWSRIQQEWRDGVRDYEGR